MEKYCKNCAAHITDADMFCPDCGREIPKAKHEIRYCSSCGEKISETEYFCKNCGIRLKEPEKEKTSFLDKHKNPIIILAVIAAIAIVSIGAFTMISPTPSQEVEVDSFTFSIPQDFMPEEDLTADENDGGVRYVTKFWQNEEDYLQIDVMYSQSKHFDANGLAKELGGDYQNLIGHDGYYNELSDAYSFTFVKDNKVITISTTNSDLFNEIELI